MESILDMSIASTTITVGGFLLGIGVSLVLGLIISLTYIETSDKSHSENFVTTLLLLPILMSTVILLIGNNVAGAFSLAGIFSIIRFRSAPGSARDIVFVLFAVGAGLACGVEAYTYGLIFTFILSFILFVVKKTNFGKRSNTHMQLRILIPEDLNNENVFDDIFNEYTKSYSLKQIRTKDLGSVYELTYDINMEQNVNKKTFLDSLRCRNGNLNINLTVGMNTSEF